MKFNIHQFLIKCTSQAWIAFVCWTILTAFFCFKNGDHKWLDYFVLGYIIITGLFIGGKTVVDAIAAFVSKGSLKVDL